MTTLVRIVNPGYLPISITEMISSGNDSPHTAGPVWVLEPGDNNGCDINIWHDKYLVIKELKETK